jgi:Major capsid protein N-terminus
MSQSAQIILGAPNPFTMNPSMTYFKTNYESQDSPLGESFEIPFDNQQVRFGTTSECTIPLYGDLLTKLFLRTTLPAIYPPQSGTYVYPSTSTSFSGALLVQKNLTFITADGSNLSANTDGSHFFSVGAEVTLSGTAYSFFNLDGVYTISSIPTANSFVCSSGLAGISYNGKVSTVGIRPAPVVGYYSTQNLNLWAETPVNLAYNSIGNQITIPAASLVPGQNITVVSSLTSKPIPGSTYTIETSSANTFTVYGASFTTPTFVAVSPFPPYFPIGGMVSYDGINWELIPFFSDVGCSAVAYGNGLFVATYPYGPPSIVTSPDGIKWTAQTAPAGYWFSVTYGNGLFVALSHIGTLSVMTSPDGINWTAQTAPTGEWIGVTYGNGLFVAVGPEAPFVMTSPDGINWTAQTAPGGYWTRVTYGNGLFVAVSTYGTPVIMTSPDGINWTPQTAPTGRWFSLTYGNGLFVAVTPYGSPSVMTSPDGITWSPQTAPSSKWYSVTYGDGRFVAV